MRTLRAFLFVSLFFLVITVCYDTKIGNMRNSIVLRGSPVQQRRMASRQDASCLTVDVNA